MQPTLAGRQVCNKDSSRKIVAQVILTPQAGHSPCQAEVKDRTEDKPLLLMLLLYDPIFSLSYSAVISLKIICSEQLFLTLNAKVRRKFK